MSPLLIAPQLAQWPLDRLIPYAKNARVHSSTQIAQLVASFKKFGFNNPILVSPDGEIIAGYGRFLAARKLGLAEVPVIVLSHLSEKQKRAFRIADNKLALNATWDLEMLRLELEELVEQSCNFELPGFTEEELTKVLAQHTPPRISHPDSVPEVKSWPVSQSGDEWELGDHRLLCGDGTQIASLTRVLAGRSCGLVFCDPPYNADYRSKGVAPMKIVNDNLGEVFAEFLSDACNAILAVCQGAVYICMSSGELHRLHAAFTGAGGHWSTFLIWVKNNFTLGRSDYQRQFEPILYGWRAGLPHYWCGDRNQGDVWFIDKPTRNDIHPTMKPVALIEQAIRNSSKRGDVVLDPFAGSGSTMIACENLGRHGRLVEIDPLYADASVRRWQQYTGETAFLHGDGRSFAELEEERLHRSADQGATA